MQITLRIDHDSPMVRSMVIVKLPEGKTWANVKDWSIDGFGINLEFDDGSERHSRFDDHLYIHSPRKVWIRDESGNHLQERDIPGKARDDLIAALTAIGGATAQMGYNGSGDEGAIEGITVYDKDRKIILSRNRDEDGMIGDPAVFERLETLGFEVLEIFVGGWEINEGSEGTINIDVGERKLILDHSQNVLKVEEEHFEV